MAFTAAEKADIRRFCGFGLWGTGGLQPASGYRFSTQYGVLEYKMISLGPEEEAVVRTTYLTNLYVLETAIFGVSANLDTAQAAVWTHNAYEYRDRKALFDGIRTEFCNFLGIGPGPGLSGGGSMSLVV
jgi:hypothetical protein